MEATATKKPVGNPALLKKPLKDARFKLVQQYDLIKPVDAETGLPISNPYPPTYIMVNEGVALDPKTGTYRNWRYVFGQKSIWVDEQTKPAPSKEQLMSAKNDIIFMNGFLRVKAADTAKIQALELNDAYVGNDNPVNNIPKVFELIDEEAEIKKGRSQRDMAFEAESEARSMSEEDMMPLALLYGIDTDLDEDLIRTHLINKSIENPKGFLESVSNPKWKAKYAITEGLKRNYIKIEAGKLIWMDNDKSLMDVNGAGDVAEQVAILVLKNDEVALAIVDKLEQMIQA